jgi:hypothetical protein
MTCLKILLNLINILRDFINIWIQTSKIKQFYPIHSDHKSSAAHMMHTWQKKKLFLVQRELFAF